MFLYKSKQSADETIDNYVVRLSKLAISCEITDKNEMIRDQVVNSCCLTKLRKKLLEEETLTLDKVKTIARTYKLSETHAKRMEPQVDEPINEEVNRVRHNQPNRSTNQGARPKTNKRTSIPPRQRRKQPDRRPQESKAICYRCGDSGHYG